MRKLLLILSLLTCLLVFPVTAQEATPEATPTSDPPVMVVTNEQNTADVVGLVSLITAAAFGAGLLVHRLIVGNDQEKRNAIAELRANRVSMAAYEKMHADSSAQAKLLFGTVVGVLKAVSPLIPGELDDDILDLLEDIQEPGEQK